MTIEIVDQQGAVGELVFPKGAVILCVKACEKPCKCYVEVGFSCKDDNGEDNRFLSSVMEIPSNTYFKLAQQIDEDYILPVNRSE